VRTNAMMDIIIMGYDSVLCLITKLDDRKVIFIMVNNWGFIFVCFVSFLTAGTMINTA
jgi:hypothetical protein